MNYSIRLQGALGKALEKTLTNRLKTVDYKQLVDPFRYRNEKAGWRCEFWGKIVRPAIWANQFIQDKELTAILEKTVDDILSTQTPDGRIASYPDDVQFTCCDIWGRKYVLLGLIAYYELVKPDPRIPDACTALLRDIEKTLAEKGLKWEETGTHLGLATCSILGAIVGTWRITKDPHWKQLAEEMMKRGCCTKHNIYREALKGTAPAEIGDGKSYELTSCYQGALEYFLSMAEEKDKLPQQEYVDACFKYFEMICEQELMITGVSGLKDAPGEFWDGGRFRQTRSGIGGIGETCILSTLLLYLERLMAISEEPNAKAAEVAENILYNGLLGAMTPDGTNFTHKNPTPMTGGGWKSPAPDQMLLCYHEPFGHHDCCRAKGPEGLALAQFLALRVAKDGSGAVINFYEPLTAKLSNAEIVIKGDYPYEKESIVEVTSKGNFTLKLRIPAFTEKVFVNGEEIKAIPGTFLELKRNWDHDTIRLVFDLSLKEETAPGSRFFTAVRRGAVILAEDSRGAKVPGAKVHEKWNGHDLVEYSIAGNEFAETNTLTVWFRN